MIYAPIQLADPAGSPTPSPAPTLAPPKVQTCMIDAEATKGKRWDKIINQMWNQTPLGTDKDACSTNGQWAMLILTLIIGVFLLCFFGCLIHLGTKYKIGCGCPPSVAGPPPSVAGPPPSVAGPI
jgi:hypothetical protein